MSTNGRASSPKTVTMVVANEIGALSRITRIIAHQRANIEKLEVTPDPQGHSHVEFVVDLDEHSCKILTRKLDRLIDVIDVRSIDA